MSKTKNRNHSMNKVKNLGYDGGLIYKQPRQESGLCCFSFASHESFAEVCHSNSPFPSCCTPETWYRIKGHENEVWCSLAAKCENIKNISFIENCVNWFTAQSLCIKITVTIQSSHILDFVLINSSQFG